MQGKMNLVKKMLYITGVMFWLMLFVIPVCADEIAESYEVNEEETLAQQQDPAQDESDYLVPTTEDGDLYWSMDVKGHLKIWGNGDYENASWNEVNLTDTDIETITIEVNVSGITSTRKMFYGVGEVQSIDLSSLDTSNVTDMRAMFMDCYLHSIDLSSLDTSNVTDMSDMFFRCEVQSLDLSSFDTSNVTQMFNMFNFCSSQSLDLSSFDTSNVTVMGYMFCNCSAQSIDLSSFDTSNVIDMRSMFYNSSAQSLDLSCFNTHKVEKMGNMFRGCHVSSLDLSGFDTKAVTDASYMFTDCPNLQYIIFPNNCNQLILNEWDGEVRYEDQKSEEYTEFPTIDEYYEVEAKQIEINGQGRAFVRYLLRDSKHNTLKNTEVLYRYEGDSAFYTLKSDNEGYIEVLSKTYNNDGNNSIIENCTVILAAKRKSISLEINKIVFSGIIINPISYEEIISGTVKASGSAQKGIGAGVEIGPIAAGVSATASAGADKSTSLSSSIKINGSAQKKSMEITATSGRKLKGDASVGAGINWNHIDNKSSLQRLEGGKIDLSGINAGGGISLGTFDSLGVNIDDALSTTTQEDLKLASLYANLLMDEYDTNDTLQLLVNRFVLSDLDTVTHGVEGNVSASAKAGSFKIGSASCTLGGAGMNILTKYSASEKTDKWTYSDQLISDASVSLADISKDVSENTKYQLCKMSEKISNNGTITAEIDKNTNEISKLKLKMAITEDTGIPLLNSTSVSTAYQEFEVEDANDIKAMTDESIGLKMLAGGIPFLKQPMDFEQEIKSFYIPSIKRKVSKSAEDKIAFDFPLSANLAVGAGLCLGINISGSISDSYDTESITVNEADDKWTVMYSTGARSTPGTMIDSKGELFKATIIEASKQFEKKVRECIYEVTGYIEDGIKNGYASIKGKVTDKINKRIATISTIKDTLLAQGSVSNAVTAFNIEENVDAQGNPIDIVSVGRVTTIGYPYIVSVTENEIELEDFSDEPLTLQIAWDQVLLSEVSIDETEMERIRIFRYDTDTNAYECLETELDQEKMLAETSIYRPGEYVLGLDTMPPVITYLNVSDQSQTPLISAGIYDISGISSITMCIDGEEVVTVNNFKNYYSENIMNYQIPDDRKLSNGDHIISLIATDSAGNCMTEAALLNITIDSSEDNSDIENDGEAKEAFSEDNDKGGETINEDSKASVTITPLNNAVVTINNGSVDNNVSARMLDTDSNVYIKTPKKVTGLKVKRKKKTITISWNKRDAEGYQIQYSLNKKFRKGKKNNTLKCKLTIKKLKKGKTYYFRVRAYKKDGKRKLFGKWSKTKSVKISK